MTCLAETSTIKSRSYRVSYISCGYSNLLLSMLSDAGKKTDKDKQKEQSKVDNNNAQSAGYDSRKTHSAKNAEDGKATGAKQ